MSEAGQCVFALSEGREHVGSRSVCLCVVGRACVCQTPVGVSGFCSLSGTLEHTCEAWITVRSFIQAQPAAMTERRPTGKTREVRREGLGWRQAGFDTWEIAMDGT
jgi:hypothetical protein